MEGSQKIKNFNRYSKDYHEWVSVLPLVKVRDKEVKNRLIYDEVKVKDRSSIDRRRLLKLLIVNYTWLYIYVYRWKTLLVNISMSFGL